MLTRWRFSLTFSLAFAHSLSCTFTAFDLLWTHQHTHARTISNVTQTITLRHTNTITRVSMYLYVNVFCGRNFCYLYVFYKFCAMFFVCRFSSSFFSFYRIIISSSFFRVWNTFGLFTSSCVILFSCFIKWLFQLGFVNQPLLGANCKTAFFFGKLQYFDKGNWSKQIFCTHSHTRHRVENQLDFFFLLISSWTIERT